MKTELAKTEAPKGTMTAAELAAQPGSLKALLTSPAGQAQFAAALPRHMTPERFCRTAITATSRNPKLLECTRESFFRCLLDLSAMGLEPDGRRAHLIPYGKECTLVVDYKGIAELVMRSGLVSAIHADRVCDKDIFEADRGKLIRHKIDYRNPRGETYAYYSIITFKDGSEKFEVMTKEEVEAIRKRSKAGNNGPWVSDYHEMAKKTVFKRASKWVSLSPEIRQAIEHGDDEHFAANTIRATTADVPAFVSADAPKAIDVGGTAEEVPQPADQDGNADENQVEW
jgi:recombination protein RecT